MAFTYTVEGIEVIGRYKHVYGTFTNTGGSTGGSIATGLNMLHAGTMTDIANAVHDGVDVVDITTTGGTMVIVTDADVDGIWEAIGS